MKKRLGQVWVETVVYTLIALVIIGSALAFVKPKLEELQDRSVLEQSSELMENLNSLVISAVQGGTGNVRIVDLLIKNGKMEIDGLNNLVVFSMESKYQYGEIDQEIPSGNLITLTKKRGDVFDVSYTLNYSRYDITYNGENVPGTITKSSNLQKISIKNKGATGNDGKLLLDFVNN